jgi:protein CpxP
MKKMTLKTSLMAVFVSSALLSGHLYASDSTNIEPKSNVHHKQGDREAGHKGPLHKMLEKLDLSQEQKAQVKVIVGKYKQDKPDRKTDKAMKGEKRDEMLSLVTADHFDESKASELVAAQSAEQSQRMLNNLRMQNEIYQLLSPEQKDVFKDGAGKQNRHHKKQ